jgi:hypothetical protein
MGKSRSTYYWYLKFILVWDGFGLGLCLGVKEKNILLTNEIVRNWWFELF